jgi:hypothetical protein
MGILDDVLAVAKRVSGKVSDVIPDAIEKPTVSAAKKAGSIAMGAIEQVSRPMYAVQNPIVRAVVDKDYDFIGNFVDGATLKEKKVLSDMINHYYKPVTIPGKVAGAGLGIAANILGDPLTHSGVALVDDAGRIIKRGSDAYRSVRASRVMGSDVGSKRVLTFMGKPISKTGAVVDPISRVVETTKHLLREQDNLVGDFLNLPSYVSTKYRPKDVPVDVWEKFQIARDDAIAVGREIDQTSFEGAVALKKTITDAGLTTDQVGDILYQIETGIRLTPGVKMAKEAKSAIGKRYISLDEASKAAYDSVLDSTDEAFKVLRERYANLNTTTKQLIQEDGYNYIPHVKIKTGKEKPIGIDLGLGREYTTKTVSDIGRTLMKVDQPAGDAMMSTVTGAIYRNGAKVRQLKSIELAEVNDFIKAGKYDTPIGNVGQLTVREVNHHAGYNIFTEELPTLVATMGRRVAKVVKGDEFFKMAKRFGSQERHAGYVRSSAPNLRGYFFPESIAKRIDEVHDVLTKSDASRGFVKYFDKATSEFKRWATVMRLPFHSRNFIGGVWQNFTLGTNPTVYPQAVKIAMNATYGKGALGASDVKWLKEFRARGLLRTGQIRGDIDTSIQKQLTTIADYWQQALKAKSAGGWMANGVNIWERGGSLLGDMVENANRMAIYISKRKGGYTSAEAARWVRKAHFDYDDITKTEREIKRFIPFWSWTKNNVPLQIENILYRPAALSRLRAMQEGVESAFVDDEMNRQALPEAVRDDLVIYVGKGRYLNLTNVLPFGDIVRLSGNKAFVELMNMVNPILKQAGEQVLNQNFYFTNPESSRKVKLTEQKGIKGFIGYGEKPFFMFDIPGRLEHLARLYAPFNDFEKILGVANPAIMNKLRSKDRGQLFLDFITGAKTVDASEEKALKSALSGNNAESRAMKTQVHKLIEIAKKYPEDARLIADIRRKAVLYSKIKEKEAIERAIRIKDIVNTEPE